MTNVPPDKSETDMISIEPKPKKIMVMQEFYFCEKIKTVEFEITGTHKLEGTPYRYVFTNFYENKL